MRLFRRPPKTTAEPQFAPRDDKLLQAIQSVLDDGVAEDRDEFAGQGGRYNGYCFVACEAYYRLVREEDAYYRELAPDPLVKLRYFPKPKPGEGGQRRSRAESHYWLVNSRGEIIDLTYPPDERPNYKHYTDEDAGGRGIPNRSREAAAIIEAVKRKFPPPVGERRSS